jgi:O-antigen/teichoic acid export membrane protein
MILVVSAEDLMLIWTGNPSLAASVAPLISLLAIGTALNGIMYIPHALQLAFGMTKIPITINGVLMILIVPLTVILAQAYGAIGGAIAWFILHAMYVLLGTWLTHRTLLMGQGIRWIFVDIGIPFCLSVIAGIMATSVFQGGEFSVYSKVAISGSLALLVMIVGILLTPKLFVLITSNLRAKNRFSPTNLHGGGGVE